MIRFWQYFKRFSSVYLTTLPGNYTNRKIEILKEFYVLSTDFLNSLDIEYWLAYGTLLGYYREKDLLRHDIDLDFGATEDAYYVILSNKDRLCRKIRLYDTSNNHKGPKLFMSYKGFDADIYFYEKRIDLLRPFLKSSIPSDMTPVPIQMIFPLQKCEFLGSSTVLPHDPKSYLEHCYGYIGRNAAFDKETGFFYEKRANLTK